MDKLNKLSLPATIVIASFVLGGFYFAGEVNKQLSIERQQDIRVDQEQKEYVAKRKSECYELWEKEKHEWNNVDDQWWYNAEKDVCVLSYVQPEEKIYSAEECERKHLSLNIRSDGLGTYYCVESETTFTKEF